MITVPEYCRACGASIQVGREVSTGRQYHRKECEQRLRFRKICLTSKTYWSLEKENEFVQQNVQ